MNSQTDEFSPRRARLLTLLVVLGVAAGITLANLSSEPLTADVLAGTLFEGKTVERAFGWPLTWYWRSSSLSSPNWTVSRYEQSALAANVAVWLAITVALLATCEWLLRRYRPRLRCRPRVVTLLVLIIVLAITVLANMSFDVAPDELWTRFEHGWPFIWYQRTESSLLLANATYQSARFQSGQAGR